ncbi:collagen-like protein [Zobellia galactanivorans]|uniref:Conserved hypothetical lipoprotein n=1 Tax=Zobellia galactanivorans (strain DSM 12802 / CCUG 47099 / CIP 106680 / NCIMB 13871 / Dsij) TaxID=63186 RepID=G0L8E2_ZOBGA|nr:collagen-like protein [Zobellia galactanivorans]CAZ97492.1 Conserved hypothetical lipoprotein [Zobellia galactanivorans]
MGTKGVLYGLLLVLLLVSCSKDGNDGALGPMGPQGETGAAGIDGRDGEDGIDGQDGADGQDGRDGEQGETGTANVISSEWFTLDFGETPINAINASDNMNVPDLDQEIRDNGLVTVFARKSNGDDYLYFQLPYHRYNPDFQYYSIKLFSAVDVLNISVSSVDGSDIYAPYLTEFRYIIVPSGSAAKGQASVDYAKMGYEDLCRHLKLDK